jgi:hypothetical protein
VSGRHDEPRIADELFALARDGTSGAVEINGEPGGTIYLNEGDLAFAESAAAPDLAARLIGSRRLSTEQWKMLLAENRPRGDFGALLVEEGLIAREDLQAVLRSIVLDVITALTVMPACRSSMAGVRLVSRAQPWVGSMLSIEIEPVLTEVARRARRLARDEVPLEARPKVSDLRGPWGTVKREHWSIACRIDGATTVQELAWRNGFALYDTIESVSELIRGGFCTLLSPEDAGPASSPPSPEAAPLPRRRQRASTPAAVPEGDGEPPFAPTNPEVLSLILDGLKQMGE